MEKHKHISEEFARCWKDSLARNPIVETKDT